MTPTPSPYVDACGSVATPAHCMVIDPQQMAVFGALFHISGFVIGLVFAGLLVWAMWRMLSALRGVHS